MNCCWKLTMLNIIIQWWNEHRQAVGMSFRSAGKNPQLVPSLHWTGHIWLAFPFICSTAYILYCTCVGPNGNYIGNQYIDNTSMWRAYKIVHQISVWWTLLMCVNYKKMPSVQIYFCHLQYILCRERYC
jgi:hypothetical protein